VCPAHGRGGSRPVFGLIAKMCLACAFDLMSPSVLSWHQKKSIGVVLPKSRKNTGHLSRLVLRPAQCPRVPQTMVSSTSQQTCRCVHIVQHPTEHKSPTQPSTQKTARFRPALDSFRPLHGRVRGGSALFWNFLDPPPPPLV
jgi:hypothetical protein